MILRHFDGVETMLESSDPSDHFYGFRTFNVDSQARLVSPINESFKWRPEENIATCTQQCTTSGPDVMDADDGGTVARVHRQPEARVFNCSCGFYSYHGKANANQYANRGHLDILGAVRCSGRIELGTKGMRTSRATVAALVQPAWAKHHRNWTDVAFFSGFPIALGVGAALSFMTYSTAGLIIAATLLAIAVLIGIVIPVYGAIFADKDVTEGRGFRALVRLYVGKYDTYVGRDKEGHDIFDTKIVLYNRMLELYPDVKVYRSLNALRRHYKFLTQADINKMQNKTEQEFLDASASDFWD